MLNVGARLFTFIAVSLVTGLLVTTYVHANISGTELAEIAINNLNRTNFIGKLRTQSRALGRIPTLFEIQHRSGFPYRLVPLADYANKYYILEQPETSDYIDIVNKRILPDAGQRPIGLMTKVLRQRLEPIASKDWKIEDSLYLGFKVKVYTTLKNDYIRIILEQNRQFPMLIEITENGRRVYDFRFESIQFVSNDLVPVNLFDYPSNFAIIKLADKSTKSNNGNTGTNSNSDDLALDYPNVSNDNRRTNENKPKFLPLIPRDLPENWLLNNISIEPFGNELIYRFEFINDKTNRIISIFQLDDNKIANPLTQKRQMGNFNLVTGELLGITYVIVGREPLSLLNLFASKLIRNDQLAYQILEALEPY